jgi:branched-chain amino acid aminotransferase
MNVLYLNGSKQKNLHAVSFYNPTFLYGINCFEGVRGYWSRAARRLIFFDLKDHLVRLYASAKHMTFDPPVTLNQLHEHILEIALQEQISEDVYVRITFFLGGEGSWHSVNDIHYMVSFRSLPSELGTRPPVALGISSYQRISAPSMPPFVKAGANYLNSRYGVLDVRARGFDDALFLTTEDAVSEASGSTLFLFKDGEIHTPSLDCDILPGITRARLIRLCQSQGIVVREKKIFRTELASYEGGVLTGTMVEIRPISRIESWTYDTHCPAHDRVIEALQEYIYQAGPNNSFVTLLS